MSTIFISHSSEDNAWAERIRDWLQGSADKQQPQYRYQSLFLDFDPEQGIPVGRSWRETLYEKLQLCRAVIVICSAAYGESQWCLAELGVAMASGKLVLPVRIDDSPPLRLLNETQRTPLVAIDLDLTGLEGWRRLERGLAALSWQERLAWPPENEPDASPFPGLSCFERKHAPVFFGQDQTLRQAQAKVEALTPSASRLLLILGASGCGKSSLLRAGLVPWLAGAEPGRWIVLDPFRPGRKPFRWLAAALEKAFRAVGQIPPSETARTAVEILEQLEELRAHSGQQDARVVLAIDQFEELLGRSDEREAATSTEADDFLSALADLLKLEGSRVLILATLRSDFLGSLQLHPSRLHSLAGDPILLGPMDVDGFRQVIEGPAPRVGLRLETGLSDRLVRDTPSGDALPLLAFTLQELWDGRADGAGLTLKQYDEFGGLEGAVQRKADEVLSTSGATAEEIEALERAFIDHLVRLTSDEQAAKQPGRLEALPAASRRLVGLFVDARLLVSGKGSDGDAVEIAHEALLRTWPKLRGWIDNGREALLQRLRVRRLGEDLSANAPNHQRRQALEALAAMASNGGAEAKAVEQDGARPLAVLLAAMEAPEADRQDAALVLALIGAEQPLWNCLGDTEAPVALRRRAAESLGLLAKRSRYEDQREAIVAELERWLRSDALNLMVLNAEGWAEHDVRLPLLQGASRGLQLAASAELPLLGSVDIIKQVPMLTLTALKEGSALKIRTGVVKVPVWRLPLPGDQQLELVVFDEGTYEIGSPNNEEGRWWYEGRRDGCGNVNVEITRHVHLKAHGIARHAITQAQWQSVAELPEAKNEMSTTPSMHCPKGIWETYALPGELPVDNVDWYSAGKWLKHLNNWLQVSWKFHGGKGAPPRLSLPSESVWEVACRAGCKAQTPFHFGDTLDSSWANYYGGNTYGPGRIKDGPRRPIPCGSSGLVNHWGLAEMHGQLMEWCNDKWHPYPAGSNWEENGYLWDAEDPELSRQGSVQKSWRILRGGSWYLGPSGCRSASRGSSNPDIAPPYGVGLRPCCLLSHGTGNDD